MTMTLILLAWFNLLSYKQYRLFGLHNLDYTQLRYILGKLPLSVCRIFTGYQHFRLKSYGTSKCHWNSKSIFGWKHREECSPQISYNIATKLSCFIALLPGCPGDCQPLILPICILPIWEQLRDLFHLPWTPNSLQTLLISWRRHWISSYLSKNWDQIVASFVWVVWYERNRRLFQQSFVSVSGIFSRVLAFAKFWSSYLFMIILGFDLPFPFSRHIPRVLGKGYL